MQNKRTAKQRSQELQNHIIEFSNWFNEASAKAKMGITLDPSAIIKSLQYSTPGILHDLYGAMQEHKVHEEQVQTAVRAIAQTMSNPGSSGIILGALQSGKTGTAFMTLFAAPVHYLKTKVSYVPLFMTTNQNSHLMQTQKAMRAFFNLYGEINIISNGKSRSLIDYYAQAGTDLIEGEEETEITLHGYTTKILDEIYPGTNLVDALVKDMTVKRVAGEISKRVRSYCDRAREYGRGVMLIVDEPQFGASSQTTRNGEKITCLLSRAFSEIDEDFFSTSTPNFMVGLSATPFDTASLDNLWMVKQKLNSNYVGPNVFGGERIDASVITKLPTALSFKEIAKNKGLEWFSEINYLLGTTQSPNRKSFRAVKVGDDGISREMSTLERRQKGAELTRTLLDVALKKKQENSSEPVGALIRIANNRRITDEVLDAMGLDGPDSPFNVIRFYNSSGDIKPLIWEATQKDKRPYIVVTVGKGRMGDAFPPSTVMAVDLTHAASDANALLQGVYGRMCGYDKQDPLVIMSEKSKDLLEQYLENSGATEDFKLSRHVKKSTVVKGKNLSESYFMITEEMIDSDDENSPLRAFKADIIKYLERQKLAEETMREDVPHRDTQFMNLPELMEKHGIVEYIAENSMRLDPELRGPAKIVKPGETSEYKRRDSTIGKIAYNLNDVGECKVLVSKVNYRTADAIREKERKDNRGGSGGLASGGRRDPAKHVNRGRRHDSIMPVITVKKVDKNGATVNLDEMGKFTFDGIIFHLEDKVRRYSATVNRTALVDGHAFSPALTNQEKAEQLAVFVSSYIDEKKDGKDAFLIAMGRADVQRVLSNMYDFNTHTYEVDEDDRTITFVNLETNEVDNPYGPAIIDMSNFENIYILDSAAYEETEVAAYKAGDGQW